MKKKKLEKIGIVVLLAIAIAMSITIMPLGKADTACSGQSCGANTTLTVGNSDPTITEVESGITITLTQSASTTQDMHFNVSDANSASDINDSTATCSGYKSGEAARTDALCTLEDSGTLWKYYNCSIDFQYYDVDAADWVWNCTVLDNSLGTANNDSVVFTINALNYVDQDVLSFAWAGALSNTDDQEAGAAINFDNGGNQDYGTCNVTAFNATNGTDIIPATAFYLNNATGTPAGTQMADNSSTAIGGWFTLPAGEGVSEDVFAYADIPTVPALTYTSQDSWVIAISS